MTGLETDQNLLFGVIALQSDMIDARQFVDACNLWTSRKTSSLADVLVEQGWLPEEDRRQVDQLLQRRLQKLPPPDHDSLNGPPSDHDGGLRLEPQRRDRVTLKGLHSTGGIGQVWIAYDAVIGRDVALKELRAERAGSTRDRERFFREAQLTGQLEHPGIVPVYEYFSSDDGARCYYTMRFVKGRTLTEAIRQHHGARDSAAEGTRDQIRLLNVFVSICQTIAYAHSRNVIHRDLKGDNVILGDFGEVIVLDWGLAKRLDEPEPLPAADAEPLQTIVGPQTALSDTSATMQGEKLGTPAYMAPEQALGQVAEIDKRTDVYGLAAILFEILAGRPPFEGASIVDEQHHVINETPTRPGELVPDVPKELEQICLRGLSKRRDHRQQSAAELAAQVQSWIADRAERKRTEQERERFFNLSLDLLGILDARGTLQQTNPAWESVLGWDREHLEGRSVYDVLHPDDHPRLMHNLERILAGEPLIAAEHRCRCKDGTHRWVLWNATLIAGEAAIYIVGRDITERKQAEETFRELLESAPDGMVVVNSSGQIVMVNAQFERLFGYSREELLGRPIEVVVPEEFRARHPANVARFVANPDFRPMGSGLRLSGLRKDGHVFAVEVSLSPVRTEQGLLVSCAVRDVTSRVSAEKPM